jgi:hypothetical protein
MGEERMGRREMYQRRRHCTVRTGFGPGVTHAVRGYPERPLNGSFVFAVLAGRLVNSDIATTVYNKQRKKHISNNRWASRVIPIPSIDELVN